MRRALNRNDGHTLPELLVALALSGMIAGASLGVYQTSQVTYTRSVSLEDAQNTARAVLDRMAADVRLIGSFWVGATGAGPAITAATSTSVTFAGDVDGNTLASDGSETMLAADAASGSTGVTVSRATGAALGSYTVQYQSAGPYSVRVEARGTTAGRAGASRVSRAILVFGWRHAILVEGNLTLSGGARVQGTVHPCGRCRGQGQGDPARQPDLPDDGRRPGARRQRHADHHPRLRPEL